MSKHTHTPGPWSLETVKTSVGTCHKIGKFPSRGAHSETSACVYADSIHEHDIGHSKVGDELLANARLIAAAPEMLGSLECSTATLEACLPHVTGERRRMVEMQIKANLSAIAKAKGE